MRVSFHANACAVAGIPAVIDPWRWALLARRERELGIQFPAAVAEWYAIAGAEAWDSAGFPPPHLTAVYDVPFREKDLAVLQEQFVAGPRTSGWAGSFGGPGLTIYRFERPGQRIWMAAHPEQTEWWLSADSAASLAALTELLASADQANPAFVCELRKGWRWTGSDWVQGPAAPGKAPADGDAQ